MNAKEEQWLSHMNSASLPRWDQLPELALYMDQVLLLVGSYLERCPGLEERELTASMVNNYVKQGVMPPPLKKKYDRVHLAHLVVICILKTVLPMSAIRAVIADGLKHGTESDCYNMFCESYERTLRRTAAEYLPAEPKADPPERRDVQYLAALRAHTEQMVALTLLAPDPETK